MENLDFDFNVPRPDLIRIFNSPYPSPLPPTRNIELLRSEADLLGPCCCCTKAPGDLTCSRCKAIKYCGQECQRKGWKKHRGVCRKIKQYREETQAAIGELQEQFGGTEALLQSRLVKEGGFKFGLGDQPPAHDQYIMARWKLVQLYVNCGQASLSCTAFRLAAENILDILCLVYSELCEPIEMFMRYAFCGWMVAGEMDQQALDYLCYFQHRLISPDRLPFLGSSDDIEEDSYLDMFKEEIGTCEWYNDFMIIALIKYKRLKTLMVQRENNVASWEAFKKPFMEGVISRAGEESVIQKIRGNDLVQFKLEGLVVEKTINTRIEQLKNQIKLMLSSVNEEDRRIIPAIIDDNSIPEPEGFFNETFHAKRASHHYGFAWQMGSADTRVLQLFLDKDQVICDHTVSEKPGTFLVEGFPQADFDDLARD